MIVDSLDYGWYPRLPDDAYFDLVRLWRFLGPNPGMHNQSSVSPSFAYFASFPESQRWSMKHTVEDIGRTYAMHAMQACDFPFHYLGEHYRQSCREGTFDITWKEFLQFGAFAACIQHYIWSLQPQQLLELFSYQCRTFLAWGDDEVIYWRTPEQDRNTVLLKVSQQGDSIVLSTNSDLGSMASPRRFADENRLWMLWNMGEEEDDGRPADIEELIRSEGGTMYFERNDIDRMLWCDGINFLGAYELAEFFASPY